MTSSMSRTLVTCTQIVVLSKNIKSMAKLYFDGVLVMHDVIENIQSVILSGMIPVGTKVRVWQQPYVSLLDKED